MDIEIMEAINNWELPEGDSLTQRINEMILPTLVKGFFGTSSTMIVGGVQYHLGGERDTEELANLAKITSSDRILDVACFLGGPAIQLAKIYNCIVTGVDKSRKYVSAANKIASLCEFNHLVTFHVADARNLPFNREFTVVWSQCSLAHDDKWLQEFDKVLQKKGRLALTFSIRKDNPDKNSPKWTLQDVSENITKLGYSIIHQDDITKRDIEIGWKNLDKKLIKHKEVFMKTLGEEWVNKAHNKFLNEIKLMRRGQWGNGRIIAVKNS
jgi:ubiquinone/menaquinone biosynthesis C-methylase UbiE